MQVPPEHNRQMAMLRAALPYVMPESRRAIEVMLQADALIHTARGMQEQEDYGLSAAEFSPEGEEKHPAPFKPDPENMLQCIREYCTPREADFIQTILNVLQANRLFRNYREFQKTHPANGHGELSAAQTGGTNSQLMEFLLSQLAPEQKSTFEQFQRIMYNERCQTPERTSYDTTTPMAES